MLKVIKYDIKTVGIFSAVMLAAALVINIINISDAAVHSLSIAAYDITQASWDNMICYGIFVIGIIGILWYKAGSNTELYEMAGISPLKVNAVRMFLVFATVTLFAYLLTLMESIAVEIYTKRMLSSVGPYINPDYYMMMNGIEFSIYGMRWTNIFQPVFMGIYASIMYTTSFLFVTINRRITNRLVSAFILASLVFTVLYINVMIVDTMNMRLPAWDINKLSMYGSFIERMGNSYIGNDYDTNANYAFMPNMLNLGILLFQSIYVAIMFTVYSMRRKAI